MHFQKIAVSIVAVFATGAFAAPAPGGEKGLTLPLATEMVKTSYDLVQSSAQKLIKQIEADRDADMIHDSYKEVIGELYEQLDLISEAAGAMKPLAVNDLQYGGDLGRKTGAAKLQYEKLTFQIANVKERYDQLMEKSKAKIEQGTADLMSKGGMIKKKVSQDSDEMRWTHAGLSGDEE